MLTSGYQERIREEQGRKGSGGGEEREMGEGKGENLGRGDASFKDMFPVTYFLPKRANVLPSPAAPPAVNGRAFERCWGSKA